MIKNIVLSASGSKFFIHFGFLKYLEKNDMIKNIETIIGCSGGAIVGFLLCLGCNVDTIVEVFLNIEYEKIKNIDTESILGFFENWGLDNGQGFERILRIFLKNILDTSKITFKELYDKTNINLVVTASNICKNTEVFFDYKTYADLDVISALMASMSIPIMFVPKKINSDVYVDGALLCCYPIEYIETNESIKKEETLGIVIISKSQICIDESNDTCIINSKIEIDTFQTYLITLLHSNMTQQLKRIYKKYKDITILAYNDRNGLDFEMSREEKLELINEGEKYTKDFLEAK
jgi:NTE family protein